MDGTLAALREALAGDAIALNDPAAIGSRSASVTARRGTDFADELADRLSVFDDDVVRAYVEGSPPPSATCSRPWRGRRPPAACTQSSSARP